ncbi:ROK family protein [Marmoricola sp. RAF53]|uniref:ROK family protein n=1 Tax=Marmoricola sp. RAF53 TaxID=3233059 RepID=UPI003F96A559
MTSVRIGVDLGGTKVLAGVVDETGRVLRRAREETRADDLDNLVEGISRVVASAAANEPVSGVGVAVAGFVDSTRSRVLVAPNLGMTDVPLRDLLEEAIGVPVSLDNDSNAAAWGEFRHGAARGREECLVVTVGTGVGAGLILDGQLRRGASGVAGEVGHVLAYRNGMPCGCGRAGCVEQYASGSALLRNTRRLLRERRTATASLLDRVGGDVDALTGPDITAAAQDGDQFAREQLAAIGSWLGEVLAGVVTVLDLDTIVLGGGVAEAGELLTEPVEAALNAAMVQRPGASRVRVLSAELGVDAGIVGAADMSVSATAVS